MSDAAELDLGNLQTSIHGALASWGHLGGSESDLLGFLLLVQEQRAEMGDGHSPLALRQATNTVLEKAIDELVYQDETGAKVLRARFIEGQIARRVAVKIHVSSDQVNRRQRTAIQNLTQIILSREITLREAQQQRLEAALLPPTYSQLFGISQVGREIKAQLMRPGEPWIVAITGIGGIGKTSLADSVVRQIIRETVFKDVHWVRISTRTPGGTAIRPEELYDHLTTDLAERLGLPVSGESAADLLARVHQLLKRRPVLIIIDNLETEEHTTFLLAQVRQLVDPSKFILTTRARPTVSAPAFFRSLDELSLEDAAGLLRHHAETIGLLELTQADESIIDGIYDVTGGNALALKLVVGLAAVMPLPQILSDLNQSRPGPIEGLYRHIYMEAWRKLTPEGQALLQAMPLVAEPGALPDQMRAISELPEKKFWPAVSELFSRSLLEARGNIQERRYGIHRLTETFLRTEIIHWPEFK